VAALESELSANHDGAHVVVVSSGTAALYLSLVGLGLKPGRKVILPSYTCNALLCAVWHARGIPVCADVAGGSVNISASTVRPLMDDSVAAIIAPHMFGCLANIDELAGLGVPVIEDCAQALGGSHRDGAPTGTKGTVSVLSFYATKLLPAGQGGACVTPDPELAERIRMLRACDETAPSPHAFNFRMSDVCAALARAKLADLPAALAERRRLADVYDAAFGESSLRRISGGRQSPCFRYLLHIDNDVDAFLGLSEAEGIMCRRPVWRPLHHTAGGECPATEALEQTLVSVPLYPGLTSEEINTVCNRLTPLTAAPPPREKDPGT